MEYGLENRGKMFTRVRVENSLRLETSLQERFARQLEHITRSENHLTTYKYDSLMAEMSKGQLFIAHHGETLIGCIGMKPIHDRFCLGYEVITFYVEKDYRGTASYLRISELLFAYVLEKADSTGVPLIFETTNPIAASFCIENLGFKCVCENNRLYIKAIFDHYLPRFKIFLGWLYNNLQKYINDKEEYTEGMSNDSDYFAFIRFPNSLLMRQLVPVHA
jgi:hypothetical protein